MKTVSSKRFDNLLMILKRNRYLAITSIFVLIPIVYSMYKYIQSQETPIYLCVLQHQIDRFHYDTYLLNIKEGDPPQSILDYFSRQGYPVGKGSNVQMGQTGPDISGYVDKTTLRPAIWYSVGEIHWRSFNSVDVECGGATATMSGGFGTCHVTCENGKWKFNSYKSEMTL